MKSRRLNICFLILFIVLPTSALGGNVITRWNQQALESVRAERLGAAPASRVYAMINVAMYDAVNGIDRKRRISYRDYALVPPSDAPAFGNRHVAASAAAYEVLAALFPELKDTYDALLASDLQNPKYQRFGSIGRGASWGEYVGQQVVDLRTGDGSSPSEIQSGSSAPGEFRADFTSSQYRNMTPFAIADKSVYLSAGPPPLDSREYLVAHTEVRLLGDSAYTNAEYDEIFQFWRGGGGSARPPGEWIKIAIVVAEDRRLTRYLAYTARLFALLGMAMADSTITAWDSKFTHHFWRPATAIQNADDDGNPDTVTDVSWIPRNTSIGGSPEHTSGQSTYAGAGSAILAGFFRNNNIAFTFEGDDAIAGPRTFESFSDAAREAGRARIFAGIHFEFSNQAGQEAGRGVAREILATALRRIR